MDNIFYVYEHWRSDLNHCFYVGKGHGNRAYQLRRNRHYNFIRDKVKASEHEIIVRIISTGLTETEANIKEIELIASWRKISNHLVNICDGGEGVRGHKHSEETRDIIKKKRATQKRVPCSEETKQKISFANKGKKRASESIKKQAESLRGRKMPPDQVAKLIAALIGGKRTPEQKAKMSIAQKGHYVSEETKRKQSEIRKQLGPSDGLIAWYKSAERKIKMSAIHKGKKISDEAKAKISEAKKGNVVSEETKRKLSLASKNYWDRMRVAKCKLSTN